MDQLDKEYWNLRYQTGQTGWDLGAISTPLKCYIDQLSNQNLKILIPGCGNGYEGLYLWSKGYKNTFFLDLAPLALLNIHNKNPEIPQEQLLSQDFFQLQGQFDLILEQTLFCAINPNLRSQYAKKVFELLKPQGKLVGVLFDKEFSEGPPFGGNQNEYQQLFSKYFSNIQINRCYNSIPKRKDSELFVIIKKS